jgi:hypothetical protein
MSKNLLEIFNRYTPDDASARALLSADADGVSLRADKCRGCKRRYRRKTEEHDRAASLVVEEWLFMKSGNKHNARYREYREHDGYKHGLGRLLAEALRIKSREPGIDAVTQIAHSDNRDKYRNDACRDKQTDKAALGRLFFVFDGTRVGFRIIGDDYVIDRKGEYQHYRRRDNGCGEEHRFPREYLKTNGYIEIKNDRCDVRRRGYEEISLDESLAGKIFRKQSQNGRP